MSILHRRDQPQRITGVEMPALAPLKWLPSICWEKVSGLFQSHWKSTDTSIPYGYPGQVAMKTAGAFLLSSSVRCLMSSSLSLSCPFPTPTHANSHLAFVRILRSTLVRLGASHSLAFKRYQWHPCEEERPGRVREVAWAFERAKCRGKPWRKAQRIRKCGPEGCTEYLPLVLSCCPSVSSHPSFACDENKQPRANVDESARKYLSQTDPEQLWREKEQGLSLTTGGRKN